VQTNVSVLVDMTHLFYDIFATPPWKRNMLRLLYQRFSTGWQRSRSKRYGTKSLSYY